MPLTGKSSGTQGEDKMVKTATQGASWLEDMNSKVLNNFFNVGPVFQSIYTHYNYRKELQVFQDSCSVFIYPQFVPFYSERIIYKASPHAGFDPPSIQTASSTERES